MIGLSGFFKNIQNAFTKEVVLKTTIKEAIKKCSGIDIPIEHISCKGSTVNLKNVNQAVVSQIYIKKQKILEELKATQTIKVITDIR